MLNRHAIVLFLGLAALVLLRGFAPVATGALGVAFVSMVGGLFLDPGHPSARATAAHLLQATAAVLLLWNAAVLALAGWSVGHLALGELGIACVLLGVLFEMRSALAWLRAAVALHALGDVLFLSAFALALANRSQRPSGIGWVFIALAGLVSLYAAIVNLGLQLARLRNPQAGWRYRVLKCDENGIQLKTLEGTANVAWRWVEGIKPVDPRHLLFVLPSPLPPELSDAGLPVEELRENAEPAPGESPLPSRYALVLHEQELGLPLQVAQKRLEQLRQSTADSRPPDHV